MDVLISLNNRFQWQLKLNQNQFNLNLMIDDSEPINNKILSELYCSLSKKLLIYNLVKIYFETEKK